MRNDRFKLDLVSLANNLIDQFINNFKFETEFKLSVCQVTKITLKPTLLETNLTKSTTITDGHSFRDVFLNLYCKPLT